MEMKGKTKTKTEVTNNRKEIWPYFCPILLKGEPEPLEKEFNVILGSQREV